MKSGKNNRALKLTYTEHMAYSHFSPKPDKPNSEKKSLNSTGNKYFVPVDDIRMSFAVSICYILFRMTIFSSSSYA